MKLRTRKKWLCTLLALGWLFVCNVAVAETAFVLLHDFADSHHHSDDSHSDDGHFHGDHEHHTTHHPGHSQEHRHGENSDPHSHGKATPTSFTSPRQVLTFSPVDFSFFQPLSVVGFTYLDLLNVWEPATLKMAIGPPGESIASYLLSSLTVSSNAPPATFLL